MKELVLTYDITTYLKDGLGRKSVNLCVFLQYFLIFNVFMDVQVR